MKGAVRELRSSSELRYGIDQNFHKQGIEIPFPQHDWHIKSDATKSPSPAASKAGDPWPDDERT